MRFVRGANNDYAAPVSERVVRFPLSLWERAGVRVFSSFLAGKVAFAGGGKALADTLSGQHVMEDIARDVGQAEISTRVTEG